MATNELRNIIKAITETNDHTIMEVKSLKSNYHEENIDTWEKIPFSESQLKKHFSWSLSRQANHFQIVIVAFTLVTDTATSDIINKEVINAAREKRQWISYHHFKTTSIQEIGFIRDLHTKLTFRQDVIQTLQGEMKGEEEFPQFELVTRVV